MLFQNRIQKLKFINSNIFNQMKISDQHQKMSKFKQRIIEALGDIKNYNNNQSQNNLQGHGYKLQRCRFITQNNSKYKTTTFLPKQRNTYPYLSNSNSNFKNICSLIQKQQPLIYRIKRKSKQKLIESIQKINRHQGQNKIQPIQTQSFKRFQKQNSQTLFFKPLNFRKVQYKRLKNTLQIKNKCMEGKDSKLFDNFYNPIKAKIQRLTEPQFQQLSKDSQELCRWGSEEQHFGSFLPYQFII